MTTVLRSGNTCVTINFEKIVSVTSTSAHLLVDSRNKETGIVGRELISFEDHPALVEEVLRKIKELGLIHFVEVGKALVEKETVPHKIEYTYDYSYSIAFPSLKAYQEGVKRLESQDRFILTLQPSRFHICAYLRPYYQSIKVEDNKKFLSGELGA